MTALWLPYGYHKTALWLLYGYATATVYYLIATLYIAYLMATLQYIDGHPTLHPPCCYHMATLPYDHHAMAIFYYDYAILSYGYPTLPHSYTTLVCSYHMAIIWLPYIPYGYTTPANIWVLTVLPILYKCRCSLLYIHIHRFTYQ